MVWRGAQLGKGLWLGEEQIFVASAPFRDMFVAVKDGIIVNVSLWSQDPLWRTDPEAVAQGAVWAGVESCYQRRQ